MNTITPQNGDGNGLEAIAMSFPNVVGISNFLST